MGGATKRSFISAYFLLSAYFLTAQSYKCMCLTTRVYGIACRKVLRLLQSQLEVKAHNTVDSGC